MSCIVVKKLLGYELCIFEKEGTLYYSDHVVLIRKAGFSEIYNLDTMKHEVGDVMERNLTREMIYQYIRDHQADFISPAKV